MPHAADEWKLARCLHRVSLHHRPAHLYRSLLEASALGLRWIVEMLQVVAFQSISSSLRADCLITIRSWSKSTQTCSANRSWSIPASMVQRWVQPFSVHSPLERSSRRLLRCARCRSPKPARSHLQKPIVPIAKPTTPFTQSIMLSENSFRKLPLNIPVNQLTRFSAQD